jgi:CHAD domain-containing protein
MAKATPQSDDAPALARTLNGRVEELRQLVRVALRSSDAEAIHQARVTTRRLKAAVDVLRPLLSEEPRREFAKSLRRLRRTLGPLRDLDVMLMHLGGLRAPRGCAAGLAWVSQRMHQRRDDLRRRAARDHSPRQLLASLGAWIDLEGDVAESQAAASLLLRQVAPAQLRAFADRADAIAREHDAAPMPTMAPGPRPAGAAAEAQADDVHELRIAGKLLRYTLELAEPLGYRVPRPVFRTFKKLQDALGLWHDYVVLTDEMLRLALEAELSIRHPQVHGSVLEVARACWRRSDRYLQEFRKLWLQHGEALAARVADVFAAPQPHAAPEATHLPAQNAPRSHAPEMAIDAREQHGDAGQPDAGRSTARRSA